MLGRRVQPGTQALSPDQGLLVPALNNLSLHAPSLSCCCLSPGPHCCGAMQPPHWISTRSYPVGSVAQLRLSGGLHTVGSSRSPLSGSPIFPRTRPSSPAGIRRPSRPCAQGRVRKQTDPGPEPGASASSSVEWHGQACLGGRGGRTHAEPECLA